MIPTKLIQCLDDFTHYTDYFGIKMASNKNMLNYIYI